MLNKVILMGRLTAAPELKHTQSGIAVTSVTLAVERDAADRKTDFLDVVTWGKTAEFVARYFGKGQLIAVEGRLHTRTWEDQNGNRRKAVEVTGDRCYFAGSRPQAAPQPMAQPQTELPPLPYSPREAFDADLSDEDLPF